MWLLLALACTPWSDVDLDGDGVRAPADCDDGDASVHPGATDPVGDDRDTNCDGLDGVDGDGDGVAAAPGGEDCDDGDPDVHPGATEVCNGKDDDCVDGVDVGAVDAVTWYADADGDGFGDSGVATAVCGDPGAGQVTDGSDCDDASAAAHPGAPEPCAFPVDLDCDGGASVCDPLAGELDPDGMIALVGTEAGGRAGWVAAVANLDGDAFPDLVVGGPEADAAWLISGPISGSGALDDLATAAIRGTGTDGAGIAVAAVGDADGDGLDEVLIGAWRDDVGGIDAGAAWLLSPPVLGQATLSTSSLQLSGEDPGDAAGRAVAGPGDADDDGVPDLLIGAPGFGTGGAAYLVSGTVPANRTLGASDLTLATSEPMADAGWAVGGGDFDGDGVADLVIGGPGAVEGRLWLVTGKAGVAGLSVDLGSADGILIGTAAGDALGWSIAVGDVDGDGRADVWIGAPGTTADTGAAWLVLGNAEPPPGPVSVAAAAGGTRAVGAVPGERLGESVAVLPDVDGDGLPELAAAGTGAERAAVDEGAAWVWLGPAVGSFDTAAADAWAYGAGDGDALGAALLGADLNGDGVGDLLFGAPAAGAGGAGPGALLLRYGG